MADDERIRRFLEGIGQGEVLESVAAALEVVPEGLGTEERRDDARNAAAKLARRETLAPQERFALESIVIPDKRPAIFIENGTYTVAHALWLHLDQEPVKARLCRTFRSIGRIELPGHPSLPYGGTGFVVGEKLLMTNRHVAEIFAAGLGTRIAFRTGLTAGVDFLQERGTPREDAVLIAVRRVVMIHPYWDMALLEVEGLDPAHPPLELAVRSPEDDLADGTNPAEVAVVGYPAFDPRNAADVQTAVFEGVFNVKRLQPGLLKPRARVESFGRTVDAATHDASTLGGNSGSAVIDIASGRVIALHFAGRYLEANYAVPAADLAQDPRVVDAGVIFTPTPARGTDPYQRWWTMTDDNKPGPTRAGEASPAIPQAPTPPAPAAPRIAGGAVTVTIPLQITVSLGDPSSDGIRPPARTEEPASVEAAAAPPPKPTPPVRDAQAAAEGPLTFRDPFLSLYQSIAEEVARQSATLESLNAGPEPAIILAAESVAAARDARLTEVPAGGGAALESLTPIEYGKRCASLAMQMLRAKVLGDHATLARLKDELEAGQCDPGWATTIEAYAAYFGIGGQRRPPLYTTPAQAGERVLPLAAGCRIGLIGDWGTGAGPARRLLGLVAAQKPDLLIHLGDIYYSGTPEECARKFEAEMVAAFGPKETRIPIFTLSGNHDMYCGGVGYYGLIERLNRAPHVQLASFFCLRSVEAGWQILAMDTGLHDHSPLGVADAVTFVEADEQAWLKRRIDEFPGRTILLSHHQLFSAFARIGPKDEGGRADPVNRPLLRMYDGFGAGRDRVAAWFWGHEHNLCVYEPYAGLTRGRCIGHGAVPVFVEDDPYEPLAEVSAPPQIVPRTRLSHDGSYYRHGFAMLQLGAGGTGSAGYFEDRNGIAVQTYSEAL
ncbi:metallophosphoesterase [Methylobacterium sp. EM32]|uniref:metallophosphoesterase n=1 Tax=Methylobacterium sp. EM32 TaxID=3163481 RepID=UPI0033A74BA5